MPSWFRSKSSGQGQEPAAPKYVVLNKTQAEEDAFDYVKERNNPHTYGVVGSLAHLVKGALGGGILSGHYAFYQGGALTASVLTVILGAYVGICLYLLVRSAQILYKRTRTHTMSYADVGECAVTCFPNPKVARYAKCFRYTVDFVICLDLFGACATYQLIIAKSLKQLVENTIVISSAPLKPGYPSMKMYLLMMIIPIILICLIRHLKYLAPLSIVANAVIAICAATAVYYAFIFNPKFKNMELFQSPYHVIRYLGMAAFSMSCAGVVLPIENNMKDPSKFKITLFIGISCIIVIVFVVSFFGYVAFLEQSQPPITINFPMEIFPKILKAGIALMIYVTHALNFWVPFNLVFVYIRKCHKEKHIVLWEYFYRALFVFLIAVIAILFPNIPDLMGFLGSFCLSLMAFVWPNIIYILVAWERPGFGKFKWKLWMCIFFIIIGLILFACGTVVSSIELVKIFGT